MSQAPDMLLKYACIAGEALKIFQRPLAARLNRPMAACGCQPVADHPCDLISCQRVVIPDFGQRGEAICHCALAGLLGWVGGLEAHGDRLITLACVYGGSGGQREGRQVESCELVMLSAPERARSVGNSHACLHQKRPK